MFEKKYQRLDNQLALWLGPYLEIIPQSQSEVISPNSFKSKLFIVCKEFIKDFIKIFRINSVFDKKVIAFVETDNNINALSFLGNRVLFVSSSSQISKNVIYTRLKFFYNFCYFFFMIWLCFSKKTKDRKKYFNRFELIFKAFGVVEEYKRVLKKSRPNMVIFSNDHNIYSRGLLIACKELKIKTVYVQHAAVSEYFPKLEFDLSLLEGDDSKNKYLRNFKTKGVIKLIGMPKFDFFSTQINKNVKVKSVGICYNLNDKLEDVVKVVNHVRKCLPKLKIILRRHPNDKRLIPINNFINMSHSQNETSFEFLKVVDLVIVGNSSIALEAVLMNVVPVYYNFAAKNNDFDDYYGFVKNGLMREAVDLESLVEYILSEVNDKSAVQHKAKYYNDVIGTEFYGKSSELALKYIEEII